MARITSSPTTVTVTTIPAWVPSVGNFASVSLANASTVDPDPTNTKVYWGNAGFVSIWNAYNGAAYAPTLGTYGSMLFFGGGHDSYEGNEVVRYDIGLRSWELFTQPDETGTKHTIGNPSQTSGDSDTANDRVGLQGHWIKDGYGAAYAGTEVTGNSTTAWKPYPIHTNCGITFLPPDAGGGSLGSLIVCGHDQTGINVPTQTSGSRIFRLDLSSKVWSVHSSPYVHVNAGPDVVGCEYDSLNKVIWVVPPYTGGMRAYNFVTGTAWTVASPNLNNSADYANLVFMPTRKILLRVTLGKAITAINVANYADGVTTSLPSYTLNVSGTAPSTLWNAYGANDKLDFCSLDGCLYFVERTTGGSTITLYRLTPPVVGDEQRGTWVWSSETITLKSGDPYGNFACAGAGREPAWGGRARYVPSVKSIILSDMPTYPVQAVRSRSWA